MKRQAMRLLIMVGLLLVSIWQGEVRVSAAPGLRAHAEVFAPEAPTNESEPNNTKELANVIGLGAGNYVSATINTSDVDWFKFEAKASVAYIVEVFNAAGALIPGAGLVYYEVFDPTDTRIAVAETGVGNVNAMEQFSATQAGTYFIKVFDPLSCCWRFGSGPYYLRVMPNWDQPEAAWDALYEPNNMPAHAFEIQLGALNALSTTVETRSTSYRTYAPDVDWYRFKATQGQSYVIELFNVAKSTNSGTAPMRLEIRDVNFSTVALDGGSGSGDSNSAAEFDAEFTGVYYIKAYPDPGCCTAAGSGPYNIRVLPRYDQPQTTWDSNHEPNNFMTNAFRIQLGRSNALATLSEARSNSYQTYRADEDWFYFRAIAGQSYVVEVFNEAKAINTGMLLNIYDSNSSPIASADGYGSANARVAVEFKATLTGAYFVLVRPAVSCCTFTGAGPYNIRVLPKYDQAEAGWDVAIEPNNFVSSSYPLEISACPQHTSIIPRNISYITNYPDRDWFVFTTQRNKQYTFEVTHTVGQFAENGLELFLYDKELSPIASSVGGNKPVVNFTANYDGLYFAYVVPYDGNAIGTYAVRAFEPLTQACGPDGVPIRAVVEGNVSTGTNPNTGEVSLTGRPGTPVVVNVANAETLSPQTFADTEAGISAYINLNQTVNLSVVDDVCRTTESSTADYFLCSVGVPDYDESQDVKVYVQKTGWALAYYPRTEATGKIFDWRHYDGGAAIPTKLEKVIERVLQKAGSSATGISYYHFARPEANKMLLIAEKASNGTSGDSFTVNLPSSFNYFERSWSLVGHLANG